MRVAKLSGNYTFLASWSDFREFCYIRRILSKFDLKEINLDFIRVKILPEAKVVSRDKNLQSSLSEDVRLNILIYLNSQAGVQKSNPQAGGTP